MKKHTLRQPELNNFRMRYAEADHGLKLSKFNAEMLYQLETIRQWGPTIMERLNKLEKEIFTDVLLDIQVLTDEIEVKVFHNQKYL